MLNVVMAFKLLTAEGHCTKCIMCLSVSHSTCLLLKPSLGPMSLEQQQNRHNVKLLSRNTGSSSASDC